jgi:hypothetical protein
MWHQICEACKAGILAGAGACATFFGTATADATKRRQARIATIGGCAGGGHTATDHDEDCVAQQHQFPSQLTGHKALPNQNHRDLKTDQPGSFS